MNPCWVIGLMSGTSADGIDAALVHTDGESRFQFVDFLSVAYDSVFRERLLSCATGKSNETEVAAVENELTERHVDAVKQLSNKHDVRVELIGFHGHTISHRPIDGHTHQIGNGPLLADRCSTPVVFDFRSADMAAGGQGAPLAALFHKMLFREMPKPCAVVNIGGVANLTWLDDSSVTAGDTGPGCGLMDAWVQRKTGRPYDQDGIFAEQGTPDPTVIDGLNSIDYFAKPFPKSADRFDFNSISVGHLSTVDGAATLCAVTAQSIANSTSQLGSPVTTWVTGGGARHPTIFRYLREKLGDVRPVESAGFRSESLEAECFAWLAVRRIRNLPTTIPSTTGCAKPTCGGRHITPQS